VVTVSEVLHGLELLVNDADAGLVSSVDDVVNVFGGLAQGLELLVQALGSLNSGLRVEFGWNKLSAMIYGDGAGNTNQGRKP
jgi:hypothetical protein